MPFQYLFGPVRVLKEKCWRKKLSKVKWKHGCNLGSLITRKTGDITWVRRELSFLTWFGILNVGLMTFFFFFSQMDVHTCSLTYMPNTLHPHTNICSNSHRRVNNPGASKACTCTLLPWLHMVINDRWIQPHTSPSTSRLNNHEQSSIIKNNSIHYISHS